MHLRLWQLRRCNVTALSGSGGCSIGCGNRADCVHATAATAAAVLSVMQGLAVELCGCSDRKTVHTYWRVTSKVYFLAAGQR
jgi:hypothetical protein